jgi:hypothetical protein
MKSIFFSEFPLFFSFANPTRMLLRPIYFNTLVVKTSSIKVVGSAVLATSWFLLLAKGDLEEGWIGLNYLNRRVSIAAMLQQRQCCFLPPSLDRGKPKTGPSTSHSKRRANNF